MTSSLSGDLGSTSLVSPARRRENNLNPTRSAPYPFTCVHGVAGGRYYLVQTLPELELFLQHAQQQRVIAVDTETSGLNWVHSDACGIVVGWGAAHNFYLPIDHKTNEKQLAIDRIRPGLQKLFENPDTTKLFHNAKFDLHMLAKLDLHVGGQFHDVVTLSFLVNENGDHGLKDLAEAHIDKNAGHWERSVNQWRVNEAKRRRAAFSEMLKARAVELKEDPEAVARAQEVVDAKKAIGKRGSIAVELKHIAKEELADHFLAKNKKAQVTYDYLPLDVMMPYACADTHYTFLLYKKYAYEVLQDPSLRELYKVEQYLTRVLFEVEHIGIKTDVPYLHNLEPELARQILELEKKVHSEVGYEFNLGSDQQLVAAFQKVGVQLTKLTKGSRKKRKEGDFETPAKYSVDAEVLESLATRHHFARTVLDYRSACKIKGTYVDGLLELRDPNDYIHTTFNQNVRTGRLSSKQPNLTNIPNRDNRIRRAFVVPSEEFIYVSIDFSQIELRLTAHCSQDPRLLACYPFEGKGIDVHTLTTAEVVMDLPYDEVMRMKGDKSKHDKKNSQCVCDACTVKFSRTIAKRVNFGIVYGAAGETIQRQVSTPERPVSKETCDAYIDAYLNKYRGVKQWIKSNKQFLHRHGFVQNEFGRYRRFPEIKKKGLDQWIKAGYERQATNFKIQGLAADLFKTAICRIHRLLKKHNARTRIINLVHDDVQFYWHRDEIGLLPEVKKEMEDFNFSVPIVAEVAYSKTDWSTKKELYE